ncbi:MAG: sigma-70 family RNA polymerase sigma factor [Planctomycetota bacterium]
MSGSRPAFEALVQRYAGRVVSVLEHRTGDHETACDLCQEVWIRVHRSFDRGDFDPRTGGSFRSWLFSIALNLARDEARSKARRARHQDDTIDPGDRDESDPRSSGALERIEQSDAIEQALARVEEPFRTAIVLVDVEGLDYQEAAESAGCALGTMKSRVARGRAAFREHWQILVGSDPTDGRPEEGTNR